MNPALSEADLLKQIFALVISANIYPETTPLEWMSDLYYMHKRRWLYCSLKGSQLMAVAGAFRIPEWNEKYRSSMPEGEKGSILFVPFIASSEKISIALLRLVRFCIRENAGVRELIYCRKKRNASSWSLVRKQIEKPSLVLTRSSSVSPETLLPLPQALCDN